MKTCFAICWLTLSPALHAALTVSLTPAAESPRSVGQLVNWKAEATDAKNPVWYRFRYRTTGDYRIIRDFSPLSELDWTLPLQNGAFTMEVTARDQSTGEFASAETRFSVTSPAADGLPHVRGIGHALVFVYSAPECLAGGRMRASFRSPATRTQYTPWRDCQPGEDMHFYVAGLRPNSSYQVVGELERNAQVTQLSPVGVTTGDLPADVPIPAQSLLHTGAGVSSEGFVVQAPLFPNRPTAADLEGNVVWYYPGTISILARHESGGRFWGFTQAPGSRPAQVIREFDLAGITLRETNAARINEQLAAWGMRPMGAFHHEVRSLPNGHVMALTSIEQFMTGVQGDGEVNVLGDGIVILDQDLNLVWAWDGFDHLDPRQRALLDQKCSGGGCPPLFLSRDANDWTHANSAQLTPDGDIVISIRHLDQVVKINYANGQGDGRVVWRLGRGGDFQLDGDADAWFSHQHDAQMLDDTTLLLFDNGNLRFQKDRSVQSRGQVWRLDLAARTAKPIVNVNLGAYAFALGSAQALRNGNYHFGLGWLLPANTAFGVELAPDGTKMHHLSIGRPVYRSFRSNTLYEP